PAAGRQEHLAPRAHDGGARARHERDRGLADGRRREEQRARAAPVGRGHLSDRGVGSQDFRLPAPRSWLPFELRELRNYSATRPWGFSRPEVPRYLDRRCVITAPPDAAGNSAAQADGRGYK